MLVKFAHMADVHLGSWRYPELRLLNQRAFTQAIDTCIQEKVDFVIIAGDLFDVAMPSVDVLKEAVAELKKLNDANINCYLIPGSHDYSVTGRTFIDVLEKGGFCKNVSVIKEGNELELLNEEGIIFAGVPGKKTNLEIEQIRKLKVGSLDNYTDLLKIFVFHTTLTESKPMELMKSIDLKELPNGFDYYAAGHLHLVDIRNINGSLIVYPGPIFPNNIEELETLGKGSFFINTFNKDTKEFQTNKKEIKFNDVFTFEINVHDLSVEEANAKILLELEKQNFKDKILILKIRGCLSSGKTYEIDFEKIKKKVKDAYFMLKSTSKLTTRELELEVEAENRTINEIETDFINKYKEQVPQEFSNFSENILSLVENLDFEKQEAEKKDDFKERVFENISKLMNINFIQNKNED